MRQLEVCSRRQFLISGGAAASAAVLWPRRLVGQEGVPPIVAQYRAQAATAKIETAKLRGNVSVLLGSGGNIAVLTGKDGKVLVDSGMSTSQPQLTAALAALSSEPMTHLVNSHWHFDHTDGNEWMHGAGAVILAHENTKKRLSTAQFMQAMQAHFPPAPVAARPTESFADKTTLHWNGETLSLEHYAPAHTDSDIYVHFEHADVLHMADIWFSSNFPFFDISTGGNIDGMIAATSRTISIAGPQTIIIPGHGPIGDRAKLTAYRDMLVETRSSIATLKQQGHSLEETIAAKPTAKYDAALSGGFVTPAIYTTLVYQTL